jgi:DNA integrity scanning protein DisA with diadenylate cyclase activity
VLVCRDAAEQQKAQQHSVPHITVPRFDLTRMGQIKMATLIAFSQDVLKSADVFVFLTGVACQSIDTMVVMQVGREYELFQSVGQPRLTEHIRRAVFERTLRLALELSHEGREGKPVGTMFVIGDHREVRKYAQENRINPFRGYAEKDRNLLDESMHETVKEMSKLDGAFIVKGNGVILAGGTTLRPASPSIPLAQGLGSRHSAAAAITAGTRSIAITLSESTGAVRIWRRGQMITEIERSPRPVVDAVGPTALLT